MDIGLAFFVYTRPKHTAKVVETIKKNKFKNSYTFFNIYHIPSIKFNFQL